MRSQLKEAKDREPRDPGPQANGGGTVWTVVSPADRGGPTGANGGPTTSASDPPTGTDNNQGTSGGR